MIEVSLHSATQLRFNTSCWGWYEGDQAPESGPSMYLELPPARPDVSEDECIKRVADALLTIIAAKADQFHMLRYLGRPIPPSSWWLLDTGVEFGLKVRGSDEMVKRSARQMLVDTYAHTASLVAARSPEIAAAIADDAATWAMGDAMADVHERFTELAMNFRKRKADLSLVPATTRTTTTTTTEQPMFKKQRSIDPDYELDDDDPERSVATAARSGVKAERRAIAGVHQSRSYQLGIQMESLVASTRRALDEVRGHFTADVLRHWIADNLVEGVSKCVLRLDSRSRIVSASLLAADNSSVYTSTGRRVTVGFLARSFDAETHEFFATCDTLVIPLDKRS